MLPSEVLARADTFDITVFDVVNTWRNAQMQKAKGNVTPANLPTNVMQSMLDQVKGKKNERKNTK